MITILAENNKVAGFIVDDGRGNDKEFTKFLMSLYGAEIQNLPDEKCELNKQIDTNGLTVWCCTKHAKNNCEVL